MKNFITRLKNKIKFDRTRVYQKDEFKIWSHLHSNYISGNFLVTEKGLLEKGIYLEDYYEIVKVKKTGELMLCYCGYGLIKTTGDFYKIVRHNIDV